MSITTSQKQEPRANRAADFEGHAGKAWKIEFDRRRPEQGACLGTWFVWAPKAHAFIATPDTWGTIAMMRTGAADFSAAMFAQAKRVGYSNVAGELHSRGRQVPVRTEQDAFRLLGVAWVDPWDRTGPEAVRAR